jgi:hypothetical protein
MLAGNLRSLLPIALPTADSAQSVTHCYPRACTMAETDPSEVPLAHEPQRHHRRSRASWPAVLRSDVPARRTADQTPHRPRLDRTRRGHRRVAASSRPRPNPDDAYDERRAHVAAAQLVTRATSTFTASIRPGPARR